MSGCEALATKAELEALKQELLAKIEPKLSKSEAPSLIKEIVLPMLGFYATKNSVQAVKSLATENARWINTTGKPTAARIIPIGTQAAQALQTAQAAQAAISPLAQIAQAALSIGLLIKQLIDQKANKIELSVIAKEAEIAQSVANEAYVQAYNARSEARTANQKATKAVGDAEYAKGRAEQANSLAKAASNQASAAQSIAQMAISQANAAIAEVEQLASELEAEVRAIEQKVKAEINALEQQVKAEIAAIEKRIASEIAQLNNKIQQEIAAILNELTIFKINIVQQVYGLSGQLNQKANKYEMQTTLKGITSQVQELPTFKSNAKQLESSLTKEIAKTNKEVNTLKNTQFNPQIKPQIQTEIKPYQQKIQNLEVKQVETEKQIKVDKEQFKQIDTKLTNVLATAGITATAVQLLPQMSQQLSNLKPSPCLAPVYVPPVDSKVSTNITLTNTLQGVVVAQNAVLQGTANAINTTVQATNGIVKAMQPVLNTVKSGLDALSNFTQQAWDTLKIDKALAVMNFIMTTHNAMMLSRNLAQTLGDVSSSLLNAIGVKNPLDGSPLDVNEIVGNAIKNSIQAAIGEETYTNLASGFNRANRILQAAQGVIWAIRSMKDAALEASEVIGGWVAKIGNGMLTQGLFEDRLFPWMDENPQFKNHYRKYHEKIDDYEQALNEVSQLISASTEFTQAIQETTEAVTTMHQAVGEFDNSKEATEATAKTNSQQPTTSNSDLNKSEETTP
jgi:hypothetical protein